MNGRRSVPPGAVEYVHQRWPAEPEYTREARGAVRRWLGSLRLGDDEAEKILLAASEAIDNVVRHAYADGQRGGVNVTFWVDRDILHIDIADDGRWRDTGGGAVGRGIVLMRSLVESVVINMGANGTCVSLSQLLPEPTPGPGVGQCGSDA